MDRMDREQEWTSYPDSDLRGLIRKPAERPVDHITVRPGEVPYLTFPILEGEPWVSHAFSTRIGGTSTGDLSSMNLSYTREGEGREETVKTNFRLFAQACGFSPEDMVLSFQTHTTNIRVVGREDRGKGFSRDRNYVDVDGLVTNEPGVVLTTFYGDCVPLLAVDPVRHVIGSAHSGWKGTLNDIGGELVRTMHEQFGTDPGDVLAAIGPSICQDCFEVGEDVALLFRDRVPVEIWERTAKKGGRQGKYYLDLQELCRFNFLRAGLTEGHVSVPDLCTCCNHRYLFSHRGSGGSHGLMAAFLWMK